MNILITGANGQLGSELKKISVGYSFHFIFADRTNLNIADSNAVSLFFESNNFDYCINCAAYTAVDKAEEDKENAFAVNHIGAENLAIACKKTKTRLIHISTDYVYHNVQNKPFKENDETNPQGVYALSKLAGDEAVLKNNKNTIILRTSWVYSVFGNNFVKTMLRLGKERDELGVIFDQIGSPTNAEDLANAIMKIVENHPDNFSGIYHYSNEGVCSWYDFALAIFEFSGIHCKVKPILTAQYPTPAKRPHFSLLNKNKFKETYNQFIPYWRDSLKRCIENLESVE